MISNLKNKNILITGASSGIGKATAIECAKLGANVIITGRNKERLNNTASEICIYASNSPVCLSGDLSDDLFQNNLNRSIKDIHLHGIALCAGGVSVTPIAFAKEEKIMELFKINFFSNVSLLRSLLKNKQLKRGSSVVAVTSVLGLDGYMPGNAPYGASKSALESWIKYCALEYASKGIRFNTVHPGSVNTPMLNISSISEEQMKEAINKIPIKHIADPKEIAGPIIFLLSDYSSYITGSSLIVDGGQHLIF